MALKQKLLHQQIQKMIMTAKMQQSMHILQLPILGLDQLIAEEMSNNPLLEELSPASETDTVKDSAQTEAQTTEEYAQSDSSISSQSDENKGAPEAASDGESDIWASDFFDKSNLAKETQKYEFQQNLITKTSTLQEELTQQFKLISDSPDNWPIAEQIIGNIDENGYLTATDEEIVKAVNCSLETAAEVIRQVQTLEPAGICARNLKECLLIQLKRQGKGASHEAVIAENFLNELASKKFSQISKMLKITIAQVKKCAENIGKLNPKPGRNYAPGAMRITPDVILEKTQDGHEIIINTKNIPLLSINQAYKKMLKEKTCSKEVFDFLKEKLQNAEALLNGMTQRQITLEKVTRCVIEHQKDFLEGGMSSLNPFSLKEVAQLLQLHPSTISRTVSNKFIQTPHGTFPLKSFFSAAVATEKGILSNQKIKMMVDEIISAEPKDKPLSDQKIVKMLAEKGVNISRRTVTKYRNAYKIPPGHLRRIVKT